MNNPLSFVLKKSLAPILVCGVMFAIVCPRNATAEHDGKIQILLLGDSTTEGSVPRRLKPSGPHLEKVLERLLARKVICPRVT